MLQNIFEQKDNIIKSGKGIKEMCTLLGNDLNKNQKIDIDIETYENPSDLPDIKNIPEGTLVIFDDLMTDKTAQKKAGDIFTKGRPRGINIIFITQSYYEVPKRTIRDNSNFLILFNQNTRAVESLYRDIVNSTDMSYKEFVKFTQDVWRESKYNFITIDKTSSANKGKFRKNLDTFYIPLAYTR